MGTSGLPAQQRRHFSEKRGDLLDLEPDSFDQNIAINTRAPFFLAQAFSKRLLAQPKPEAELPHRSIIFVSSINAIMLAMNRGEYTIAKTAVSAAARLFAARLCNEQIGVYEVRPGLIKTDMTIPATAYYDELIAKGLVPWGRWGYPADIASTVRAMAEGKLDLHLWSSGRHRRRLKYAALLRLNHERSVTTPGFIQYQYRDTGL